MNKKERQEREENAMLLTHYYPYHCHSIIVGAMKTFYLILKGRLIVVMAVLAVVIMVYTNDDDLPLSQLLELTPYHHFHP